MFLILQIAFTGCAVVFVVSGIMALGKGPCR
jgi:hypothetical protein